jgi:NAD(P)H-nitrite reductase large subunit
MSAMHFFEFPVTSAGLNPTSDAKNFEILATRDGDNYKKLVLKDDIIVGMILTGDRIERAGIILNLMRRKTNVTEFKNALLGDDFGLAYVPESLRLEMIARGAEACTT